MFVSLPPRFGCECVWLHSLLCGVVRFLRLLCGVVCVATLCRLLFGCACAVKQLLLGNEPLPTTIQLCVWSFSCSFLSRMATQATPVAEAAAFTAGCSETSCRTGGDGTDEATDKAADTPATSPNHISSSLEQEFTSECPAQGSDALEEDELGHEWAQQQQRTTRKEPFVTRTQDSRAMPISR